MPEKTWSVPDFVKVVEVGPRDGLQNESAIVHYLSHPRLMPQLGGADNYAVNVQVKAGALLEPYKIAKIKRSAEIAIIFDGSLEPSPLGGWRPAFSVPDEVTVVPTTTGKPSTWPDCRLSE